MSRKKTRELIVRFLFQLEARQEDYTCLIDDFIQDNPMETEDREFFIQNIEGTVKSLDEIDGFIKDKLKNWTLERIPKVDLAVMRNALYEMLYRDDIPIKVSINEAVNLVKKYSEPDSSVFVNGVLGNIVRQHNLQ